MRKEVKEAIRELCKRTKDVRTKNYKLNTNVKDGKNKTILYR